MHYILNDLWPLWHGHYWKPIESQFIGDVRGCVIELMMNTVGKKQKNHCSRPHFSGYIFQKFWISKEAYSINFSSWYYTKSNFNVIFYLKCFDTLFEIYNIYCNREISYRWKILCIFYRQIYNVWCKISVSKNFL